MSRVMQGDGITTEAAEKVLQADLHNLVKKVAAGKPMTVAERARIEKLRRQKRPRSRAAKQRILANKSHNSAKKAARRSRSDD